MKPGSPCVLRDSGMGKWCRYILYEKKDKRLKKNYDGGNI